MTTAKPFLDTKEPDFILATDMEYEEKSFSKRQQMKPINPLPMMTPVGPKSVPKKPNAKHPQTPPN